MFRKLIFLLISLGFIKRCQSDENQYLKQFEAISQMYEDLMIEYNQPLPPKYESIEKFQKNYDFIIIGAGSAGSVVANRLSEVPQWSVLLLEAGGEPPIGGEIPAASPLFDLTEYNWKFLMEPQENFGYGFLNEQMSYTRGKVLGGSSTTNSMAATRGAPQDYDKWEQQGNEGWSWNDVLPYFIKSEDFRIGTTGDYGYHKQGGYQAIEYIKSRTISAAAYINSSIEHGEKYVDFNGRHQIGTSYLQGTTRHGRRCSVEKAFLRPAKQRKNLAIVPRAQVTKILIDPNDKAAYGVKVLYKNETFTIFAKREIILSAGAIQSPQLLMLSGVGPKQYLQKFGIPIIKELSSVGQNLRDHLWFFGFTFTVNDNTITTDISTLFSQKNMINLVRNGDGPLVRYMGVSEAFSLINFAHNYPNIEIIFQSGSNLGPIFLHVANLKTEMFNVIQNSVTNQNILTITPILLHPKSKGYVGLRSNNPLDPPIIQPNFLTDVNNDDINELLKGIRYIQQLIKMPSFRKYNTTQRHIIQPGCENYKYDTDDYWKCCIRGLSQAYFHVCGTCKMAPLEDQQGVVDSKLKVFGIKNLRVIDASIMPSTISGHTNLPTIMIGEKGADMIKKDYGIIYF